MTFIEYIKMKSKDKLTIDGELGIKTRELAQRVGINYEMFRKILNKTKPNQPRDCIIAICAALFYQNMKQMMLYFTMTIYLD